jgi:sulfonate transport system ATP-binding protein
VAVVGRSGGGKVPCCACWRAGKPNGELLAGSTPLAQIQDDTRMMFRIAPAAVENGDRQRRAWAEGPMARCRPQALASVGLENRAGSGRRRSPADKSSALRWPAR